MINFLKKLSIGVYKKFTLIWVILTIALLAIFSYFNWYKSLRSSHKLANESAMRMANHIDGFIYEVFNDVSALPVSEKKKLACETDLYPRLQRILVNHPEISGFTIRDKNYILICSTLPNYSPLNAPATRNETIHGPLKHPMFDKPIFAIQKKVGPYYIKVILVSPVLENMLSTSESHIQKITLFNQQSNKHIINVEHAHYNSWLYNKFMQTPTGISSQNIFATAKLRSINGIVLVVVSSRQAIFGSLWYTQILLTINILFLSVFIYWLIKNLIRQHYSLNGAMKRAIKKKQFRPVYQPVYNTMIQNYSGAEVLLRWEYEEDQIIMPDYFIEEAESSGLIVPITLQIIEIAFKEGQTLLQTNPEFYLSFNLTAQHFTHPSFLDSFFSLINEYSISPNQIVIEITERDLLDENNEVYSLKMNILRKLGYSLAVDDYGTGHASISYLQYFPFNYLKIDKLFINAIGTKAITESLNDAIISLAKKINLTIIAEGVETLEQVDYLQQNGVYLLQGWYYSKAISIEELNKLLQPH